MERVICLIMGYVFGLFQTGYLYSKAHHMDIRKYGSGNSGSTNVLRVMGVKAGLIVFIGDVSKMVLACLLTRYLFREQPGMVYVYLLYTGFGVVLGHNFPFYMGFKGGKGIAASAGLLAATDWRVMLACLVVFVLVVAVTRYVSLGSILVMVLFFIGMAFFGAQGDFGVAQDALPEFYTIAAVISLMGIWRHHTNIKRLLSGTENKLGAKKA
ncbi:glycerol-3-phosphate 1-O-acyltransferase [Clostridiaceae bacterium]|nr:glycerol-3-phosphate 1-O-acyltransferase [Clostridiaceae bacterium]RKI08989.1 glycerol-3-phosphate 1-O-acyltransferase [bacterium 1XD21-70]